MARLKQVSMNLNIQVLFLSFGKNKIGKNTLLTPVKHHLHERARWFPWMIK